MGISYGIDNKMLIKALNQFPTNIQKNVMNGAVRSGANVVRDRARQTVRKRTRTLEKSIATIKRRAEKNQIKFTVTPSKGGRYDGWYAHLIEFGTVHSSAYPFMRPAFEQTQDEALEATKKYMAERIPKEVEKAKR